MDPWYKVVTPRVEVREGRSFSPDEFAIALEQVVAGTSPPDYSDPKQFFSRTCFTRALTEHSGMVLRRLSGRTENTAPVLTLITQFGGGKTHTLTSLYHLANAGREAGGLPGVSELLRDAGIADAPSAQVGVFVGNAWDPSVGRETPGLIWPGSWRAKKVSPHSAALLRRHPLGPRRCRGCLLHRTRRCCFCSTKYLTSSTATVVWPNPFTLSYRI